MAVYAAPDPTFSSTNTVSCKSNVVSPESKFVGLLLENFSAPITNLVPALFKSKELPNALLLWVSGDKIVCCKV